MLSEIQLNDQVRITASREEGLVIGVATYLNAEPQALVRYCAGDRRAVERWWGFSALVVLTLPLA